MKIRKTPPRGPRVDPPHWRICPECGHDGFCNRSRTVGQTQICMYYCRVCRHAWKATFRVKQFISKSE